MKKEEFVSLGIVEDMAEKAAEASKKELEGFVPKTRFNEVNEAKKKLETDITERDTQLETLRKSSGDNEALKTQIETLQTENKTAKEKYETDMKDLKMSTAIKLSLSGKAHDEELVSGLFDRTKLILGEDGKVTGLEEQLTALKNEKSFLFKDDKPGEGKPPYTPQGGDPAKGGYAAQIAAQKNEASKAAQTSFWGAE